MKKRMKLTAFFLLGMLAFVSMVSCTKTGESTEKIVVREVTNVPGLITPGVWNGQVLSFMASIKRQSAHAWSGNRME